MRRGLVIAALALFALAAVWGVVQVVKPVWYLRLVYPLHHMAAIDLAARKNHLDPALVAAIIYEESRFRDEVSSHRGAVGLMQVLPSTAQEIARKSGGSAFVPSDLTDPRVNILYGCYYLRELLDLYGGRKVAAVAAYNAGQGNVSAWLTTSGGNLSIKEIPFTETRQYVGDVLRLQRLYRRAYTGRLAPAP